jgi:hypothetical protein
MPKIIIFWHVICGYLVMIKEKKATFKVIGNKIYVRYDKKDYSTGYDNTNRGMKLAQAYWIALKKEIDAIRSGEKQSPDSVGYIFNKFITDKKKYNKIAKRTIEYYNYCFEAVFLNKNVELTETIYTAFG